MRECKKVKNIDGIEFLEQIRKEIIKHHENDVKNVKGDK